MISQADVIERLRLQYKKDLLKVVDIVLSHQVSNSKHCLVFCRLFCFFPIVKYSILILYEFFCLQGVKSKNKLILRLLEQLVYPNPAAYRDQLIRFSALNHTSYSEVCYCTKLLN